MLSRLVITFLWRSVFQFPPSAVILEPRKIKSDTVSTVSPSISHPMTAGQLSFEGFSLGSAVIASWGQPRSRSACLSCSLNQQLPKILCSPSKRWEQGHVYPPAQADFKSLLVPCLLTFYWPKQVTRSRPASRVRSIPYPPWHLGKDADI